MLIAPVRTICAHGLGGFRGFYDPIEREDAQQQIFAAAFEAREAQLRRPQALLGLPTRDSRNGFGMLEKRSAGAHPRGGVDPGARSGG